MSEQKDIAKASAEVNLSFEQRLEKMFNELVDKKFADLEKRLDKSIEDKLHTMEVETERVLRKSFGLETDRPVMMSEVFEVMRKMQLENSESQKKTPGPDKLEKGGPDGDKKLDWVAEELKKGGYE